MKKIILLLIILLSLNSYSQNIEKYDTIVVETNYKSYYSFKIKGPSFVIYKLYKGGGSVSRKGMDFKSTLPFFDYKKSGYDIGHMADAEDFAYNEILEKETFKYYNAVPQKPNLNRGIWKSYETKIRKISQTDRLLIICGGCDYNGMIPNNCFKIVYSLSKRQILYSLVFTNNNNSSVLDDKILIGLFKEYLK